MLSIPRYDYPSRSSLEQFVAIDLHALYAETCPEHRYFCRMSMVNSSTVSDCWKTEPGWLMMRETTAKHMTLYAISCVLPTIHVAEAFTYAPSNAMN